MWWIIRTSASQGAFPFTCYLQYKQIRDLVSKITKLSLNNHFSLNNVQDPLKNEIKRSSCSVSVTWSYTDTAEFNSLYNHLEDSFHWKNLLLEHWSVEARLASQFRYTHRHESTQLGNILTCFSTVYGIGTGDKRNSVDEKTCSLTKNPFKFNRTHYKNHHVLYSLSKWWESAIAWHTGNALSAWNHGLINTVIFLDFHSTKQGLPLVDSWSHGLD